MLVASNPRNLSAADLVEHPVYLVAGRLAASRICPVPAHHMALVPTDWGYCGAVWRDLDAPPANAFQDRTESLLGRIITPGLAVTDLRGRLLREHRSCQEVLADPRGNFHPETVPEWFGELVRYLRGYFSDRLHAPVRPQFVDAWSYWRPRLDMDQLTAFQQKVLARVAQIPRGVVLTYAQVAREIGKPKAARAVGAALRANLWPVIVPCHRVIGSSGAMVGFSAPGGVEAKKKMLHMEMATL